MPWQLHGRSPLKLFRLKRIKSPERENETHRPNNINIQVEPTQSSGDASEATNYAEKRSNINVALEPSKNSRATTPSRESEDLWTQAEQRLANDERMGRILKQATQIVEESGLKFESNGIAVQQLRSFLNTKVDELEERKWVVHIDDKYIGVRDQLTRIFRNILVVKDLVNTAASASPPVAIACAGMTMSLLLFIRAAEQVDSLLEGLEKTSSLIPRLHMMEDLYLKSDANIPSDFMDKFKEGLISLYCKILEFQSLALCFLRKNSFVQTFRNMFNQDPWNALTESIKGQETEAQAFTHLIDTAERKSDREKISQDIEQAFQKQLVWQTTSSRDGKVRKFLKLLYTCPYSDRKERNNDRVPGTCEWFTSHDHFKDWNQSNDSSLLWVSADPGCGKSVLSKYLINSVLPSRGQGTICYFFFKDDYEDQKRSNIAISSILRQLFMAKPHLLSDSILAKLDTDGEKLVESFRGLWDILMSVTSRSDSGEIICVMDALDECEEEGRNLLIRAVTDLYSKNNAQKIKLLFTSRPYGHIRSEFQEIEHRMPNIHLSGENETEVEKISREIDLVIMKRVHDIAQKKSLRPEESEFLQEQLMEAPNRTYLWVSLTLNSIERLPGFTRGEFHRRVRDEIPQTVDEAYTKILNASADCEKAKRLLHIVLAAKRPLSVHELSLAMALNREGQSLDDISNETEPVERFTTTLRDLCGLILVIIDNKVYLLHQTVKEFLVQKSSSQDYPHPWKHAFAVTESNKVLAEICIWYICASSPATIPEDLLAYSILHWPDHFRKACFHRQDRTTTLAKDLCTPGSVFYDLSTMQDWRFLIRHPTPLVIASLFGLDVVVDKLLDDGTEDVNFRDPKRGRTALTWAAAKGHEAVVKVFLGSEKVETDIKDFKWGQTPLSWAAAQGHEGVVRLLLDSGRVDADSKDSQYGQTPLSLAAENGHETVVKLLLDTGKVDVNSRDSAWGRTPLLLAAGVGRDTVVKLLLDSGKVDPDSKDSKWGETPLSKAAQYGRESVVKLLLDTGKVDVDSRNFQNQTPLSLAVKEGHEGVVRLLDTGKQTSLRYEETL